MTPKPPFFDVRMRGFRDRADVADAHALIDARRNSLPAEAIALADAAGRVLAAPIVARIAVPAFDRAAMDGYALRAEETFGATSYTPLELRIVGESLPARPHLGEVLPGQAVRIMTGAPMPAGADAVLPAEAAAEHDGALRVAEPVPPLRHVGRRGEDIAPGREVLPAARVLRPQDLGLLASIGLGDVDVVRRPTVAVFATGDELLPVGSAPDGFKIVDSNSVMLAALAHRDGADVLPAVMLPDQRERLRAALLGVQADVVLVSGGSSVGKEDHAPALLAELGELAIHGLALRPAGPTGVGFLGDAIVFLMPGNPVSCLCAYDLIAGRAVRRLGGRPTAIPYRSTRRPLAEKINSALGRMDYVRVRLINGQVHPLAISGAAILSSTTAADGFVLVERDREGHAAGERGGNPCDPQSQKS